MDNIYINVETIVEELGKLRNEKKELEEILNDLDKRTDSLKEYWETRTSDEVFSGFEEFKKYFKSIISNLENDIDFLEKTVKASYEQYEDVTSKEIDNNIAI